MAVWVGVSPGVEPCAQARKYITALMGDLPSKNGWTIAEHAGDLTPDRTQRLLNHAVWDAMRVEAVVRSFVAEHLSELVAVLPTQLGNLLAVTVARTV
jgi:hypothetical protein